MSEEQQTLEDLDASKFKDPIEKKYEKPNLDGQEVTILKAELKQKNTTGTTKSGEMQYKPVLLLVYSDEKTYENYSGIRRYINEEGKLEDPTVWVEGQNNAAKLLRKWAEAKGLNPKEVSIADFVAGLAGMKAKLKHIEVTTTFNDKIYPKNIIDKFVAEK